MKRDRRFYVLIFSVFLLTGCKQKGTNDHLTMSVLRVQKAAETRALCYQAFNIAKMMIDRYTGSTAGPKKPAIIADIDETLLDNSPYQARLIKTGESFPAGWQEWTDLARAKPLPGAVDFLHYCDSLGIEIFYVSNRKLVEQAATMKNLRETGFPQIAEEHFYLRTSESSKEKRRQEIRKEFDILLMLGDNLNDFLETFEKKSVDERFAETDKNKENFGTRFIVLPNPMYGDWEGALYDYDYSLTNEEKDAIRKDALLTY